MNFSSVCRRIEKKSEVLNHQLGWRFLYSPKSTLRPNVELLLLGLNPGGSEWEPVVKSQEGGNSYRVEEWPYTGVIHKNRKPEQLAPLQRQVSRMFEVIAPIWKMEPEVLLDQTLSTNFCLFRSPSLAALNAKEESMEFSREVLSELLTFASPKVVFCIGGLTFHETQSSFEQMGYAHSISHQELCGWGAISVTFETMRSGKKQVLLVGLPHLSRFRIFGRAGAGKMEKDLRKRVAAAVA